MKTNQVSKLKFAVSLLITTLFLSISLGCVPSNVNSGTTGKSPVFYKVVRVVDGDTFVIDYGNKKEKVRLIGVNTPEIHHPRKGKEPYGPEAAAFTRSILTDQEIKLTLDVQPRDRYGRLLGYVYLQDGTFLNALLVKEGYAQVMTVPPNVKYAKYFLKLQRQAKKAGAGLWGKKH